MTTGQLQLLALTRATVRLHILKGSRLQYQRTMPILLLDEATASVDSTTELTMRRIVKEEFTDKGHTVVEISHRFSEDVTIPESGKCATVVLASGSIVTDAVEGTG